MNITDCSKGQKVHFGRSRGEKTFGEIVKVNRTRCKVKQLESRGTMKSHPVGTIWTVPPSLMTPAVDTSNTVGGALHEARHTTFVTTTTPTTKRSDDDIMRDILGCYCRLSPENLHCDGEISRSQASRKAAQIRRELRGHFTEIGRTVSESEAYHIGPNLPPSTESTMDRLARQAKAREKASGRTSDSATGVKLGLPADAVGRTFKFRRRTYKITGFKTANPKYPVLVERQPDGKRFKFPVADVLAGMAAAA